MPEAKDMSDEEIGDVKKTVPPKSYQTLRSLAIAGPDYISDHKAIPLLSRELIEEAPGATTPIIGSPPHNPNRRGIQKRYSVTALGLRVARA